MPAPQRDTIILTIIIDGRFFFKYFSVHEKQHRQKRKKERLTARISPVTQKSLPKRNMFI